MLGNFFEKIMGGSGGGGGEPEGHDKEMEMAAGGPSDDDENENKHQDKFRRAGDLDGFPENNPEKSNFNEDPGQLVDEGMRNMNTTEDKGKPTDNDEEPKAPTHL